MTDGWPDDHFLARVGTAFPILQAPMAGAGGVALAIGAAKGGALGALSCGMLGPDVVAEQAVAFRAEVSAPLNLNFFCHALPDQVDDSAWQAVLAPYYAEFGVGPPKVPPPLRAPFDAAMCAVVEAVLPEVVSFHFGLPSDDLLARVRGTRALILSSATSRQEAQWLAARGVDFIIAQGAEAGGHSARFLPADPGTETGLFALLPQIVDAVDVPVIAAGGIGDGRTIAAAFALGACAVQIGTAYLRSHESLISPAHRALLDSDAALETRFTTLFSGGPARGMPNRLMRELGADHPAVPPYPHASAALAELRKAAEAQGRTDFSPLWAGQGARHAPTLPARELTRHLAEEAQARLRSLTNLSSKEWA